MKCFRHSRLKSDRTSWCSTRSPRSLLVVLTLLVGLHAADAHSAASAVAPTLSHLDIGAVGAAGSYSLSGGALTLKGSGADIWTAADAFHFAYQPLTGDGSITARVISQTNTSSWAKAGVMFRASLAAGSTHAMVEVTPRNGAVIQSRVKTNETSVSVHGPKVVAPYWVRLVRAGNVFTGYISPNGVTWTRLGSYTITLTAQVYVGLAVTSHTKGVLSTAVFDNVAITPATTGSGSGSGSGAGSVPLTVIPGTVSVATGGSQQFAAGGSATGTLAVTWQVNGITGGNSSFGTVSTVGLYKAPAGVPTPSTVIVAAIRAKDPTLSGYAQVTITVPAPLTIGGVPTTNVSVGQAYSFTPKTTSAIGSKLTFAIANKPAWAAFSASTGTISGTPASGDIGTFANISISVSDGRTAVTLPAFTVTVSGGATGSATLRWAAPTTRSDGTVLTNLAGYRIYYGTIRGSYSSVIKLANPGLTTYVVDNLPAGTYHFACTAYDTNGAESAFTSEVSKTIR